MTPEEKAADRLKKAAYEQLAREKQPSSYEEVMWRWIKRGFPREEALYRADEWQKRNTKRR